ncbi:uncharacterized protein LOC112089214 [Eutrema salsugineum]|uniref:uncharacterized protein LOC112089214 n=1 Tax=Eutrema salsugineum TaxID=72664 RepID=UPI000CED4C90|nr:uncharacterized protein LOC112089214 [Eutrema salsugineum]
MITDEQKDVYEEILDAVLNNKCGVFFVYGLGGTGKTFIWSCLSTVIRSRGKIVINTAAELKAFSEWILAVGDGKINTPNDGVVDIDISEDLLIKDCGDPMKTIVKEMYGNLIDSQHAEDFYQHRAILSPTNEEVDQINDYMFSLLPGEEETHLIR